MATAHGPHPEEIKAARKASGLTQAQAGALVHCHWRSWQDWESGRRSMHPAIWELFLLKTGRGVRTV